MTDRKLAETINAALTAAFRSRSATFETAVEPPKNGDDSGIESPGKGYGMVLKGGNALNAAVGVTGAAAAKIYRLRAVSNLVPEGTSSTLRPPKVGDDPPAR